MTMRLKDILSIVVRLSAGEVLYLSGGYLRDLLLGRDSHDLDFTVARHPRRIATSFADLIGGSYFLMDEEHQVHRVVRGDFKYDFSLMRAKSIQDDLRLRDFTINALAIALDDKLSVSGELDVTKLIDPCRGVGDIKGKKIRVAYRGAFVDDPIRMLRAVRLAGELGFEIEEETLRLIAGHKHLINVRRQPTAEGGLPKGLSGERIRDELEKVLSLNNSYRYIRQLDRLRLLGLIIPEIEPMKGAEQGGYHHLDVWEHSLAVLESLETILANTDAHFGDLGGEVVGHLEQEMSGGRPVSTVLKLAALLHDVAKPETKVINEEGQIKFYGHESSAIPTVLGVAHDLRLSAHERSLLRDIVANHMHVGHLSRDVPPTKRAMLRFFRKAGGAAVPVIVLALADGQAIGGIYTNPDLYGKLLSTVRCLLDFYYTELKAEKPPRYINGNDILNSFPVKEGPIIGRLLEGVEEAAVEGKVKSREDALRLVAEMLQEKKNEKVL